jgi:hypothetical protein
MEPEKRKRQIMIGYRIAALIGVLVIQYFWASIRRSKPFPTASSSSC